MESRVRVKSNSRHRYSSKISMQRSVSDERIIILFYHLPLYVIRL